MCMMTMMRTKDEEDDDGEKCLAKVFFSVLVFLFAWPNNSFILIST